MLRETFSSLDIRRIDFPLLLATLIFLIVSTVSISSFLDADLAHRWVNIARWFTPVEFYKTSKLVLIERGAQPHRPPPCLGVPPTLETYRERGHRRLDARTYSAKCRSCLWGCRMAVEMIIDHWNPSVKRYRSETFCYGPKYCPLYKAGPTRKVPGRKGMTWEEQDWIDEEATSHRSMDD